MLACNSQETCSLSTRNLVASFPCRVRVAITIHGNIDLYIQVASPASATPGMATLPSLTPVTWCVVVQVLCGCCTICCLHFATVISVDEELGRNSEPTPTRVC